MAIPSVNPVPAHAIGTQVDPAADPRVELIRQTLPADARIVRAFISQVHAGQREAVHRHTLHYAAMFLTTGTAFATAPDGSVINPVEMVAGEIRHFDNVPIDHALRAPDNGDAAYLAVEYECR